jgi:ABC-type phosphate transport system substrate-binding protein
MILLDATESTVTMGNPVIWLVLTLVVLAFEILSRVIGYYKKKDTDALVDAIKGLNGSIKSINNSITIIIKDSTAMKTAMEIIKKYHELNHPNQFIPPISESKD